MSWRWRFVLYVTDSHCGQQNMLRWKLHSALTQCVLCTAVVHWSTFWLNAVSTSFSDIVLTVTFLPLISSPLINPPFPSAFLNFLKLKPASEESTVVTAGCYSWPSEEGRMLPPTDHLWECHAPSETRTVLPYYNDISPTTGFLFHTN